MITYKVILDERRAKADKRFPLVFRVSQNRKSSVFYTGISILKEHWDEKKSLVKNNAPGYKELNKNLTHKFLTLQKTILELEDENKFCFDSLKECLSAKPRQITKTMTFLLFSNVLINELFETNRTGNAVVYQTAVNRLIAFSGNNSISFKEIDFTFLDNFKRGLIKQKLKPNSIGNYFRSIRAIYNKAIKAKIVDRSHYPFTDITIKTEKTAKRAINKEDISAINALPLIINSEMWHARNYFLLSYSLIGISFTDVAYLNHSNISKGRVQYKRRKTHKFYSIKLSPMALSILKHYNGSNAKYLLPVLAPNTVEDSLQSKKTIAQWIKVTNKWLKRVGKQCDLELLTTYVARHTWATTAKRLGYSNELIAEAMGHEYGNKITNIYLDTFDQSVIDDLNEKVQSFI